MTIGRQMFYDLIQLYLNLPQVHTLFPRPVFLLHPEGGGHISSDGTATTVWVTHCLMATGFPVLAHFANLTVPNVPSPNTRTTL